MWSLSFFHRRSAWTTSQPEPHLVPVLAPRLAPHLGYVPPPRSAPCSVPVLHLKLSPVPAPHVSLSPVPAPRWRVAPAPTTRLLAGSSPEVLAGSSPLDDYVPDAAKHRTSLEPDEADNRISSVAADHLGSLQVIAAALPGGSLLDVKAQLNLSSLDGNGPDAADQHHVSSDPEDADLLILSGPVDADLQLCLFSSGPEDADLQSKHPHLRAFGFSQIPNLLKTSVL